MTRIKLCGLSRPRDIETANDLMPDYIGFVFAPKSRRYVTPDRAAELKALSDLVSEGKSFADTYFQMTDDIDLSFFTDSLDITEDWVGVPQKFKNCVRILSTKDWYGSRSLTLEMDQKHGIVKAYFI